MNKLKERIDPWIIPTITTTFGVLLGIYLSKPERIIIIQNFDATILVRIFAIIGLIACFGYMIQSTIRSKLLIITKRKENERLTTENAKMNTERNHYSKLDSQYKSACEQKDWLLSVKQIEEQYDALHLRQIENCQLFNNFLFGEVKSKVPDYDISNDSNYLYYMDKKKQLDKELAGLHNEYSEINKNKPS